MVELYQIKPFYYSLYNYNQGHIAVIVTRGDDFNMATEIAKSMGIKITFTIGIRLIDNDTSEKITDDAYTVRQSGITQGYMYPNSEPVEYKTRVEMIDEMLTEL